MGSGGANNRAGLGQWVGHPPPLPGHAASRDRHFRNVACDRREPVEPAFVHPCARLVLRKERGRLRKSPPSIARIERVKLYFLVVLPGLERVEIRNAVDAKHHRFTVNDEPLLPVP